MADQLGRSVGDMYEGAFLPGVILAGLYAGYVLLVTIVFPKAAPGLPQDAIGFREPDGARGVWQLGVLVLFSAVVGYYVLKQTDTKAGADFVMTQPIFDPALAKLTREKTRQLGIPILMGVMPLLNSRNAEFLHNEVPGISISDSIRERLRNKEGKEANAEGLKIAQELSEAVLADFPGIYFITPLMRYDLTVALSEHVRGQERSVSPGASSKQARVPSHA